MIRVLLATCLLLLAFSTPQSFSQVDKIIVEHDPENPLLLKDPVAAALFSIPVAGGGQLYNNEPDKALGFFAVAVIGFMLSFDVIDLRGDRNSSDFAWLPAKDVSNRDLGGVLILASSLVSATEAHQSAKRINKKLLLARKLQVNPISSRKQIGLKLAYRF